MEALFELAGAMIGVLVLLFVIIIISWVVNAAFLMKFANAMYYSHPALAWIPLPGFMNMVFINSMNQNFPMAVSEKFVTIFCMCMNLSFLSAVPVVGFLFTIAGGLCGITTFVFMVMQLYTACRDLGTSFVLCLLLILFVPFVGMIIVEHIIRKAYENGY